MTTIGERIRTERKRQGLTQQDLAQYAGIAKQTLSDLENGSSKSTTTLPKIAERLGLSASWLQTGRGPKESTHGDADADVAAIKAYANGIALGDGSTPEEYAEAHRLLFRKSSLRRKGILGRQLEVYYGRGDSMEPRIHDGDAILVDRDDCSPKDGHVFVIEGPGGAMAKRLINIDGKWFFESDNKSDPKWRKPTPMDGKNTYQIVGKVRWIGSWEG